MLSLERRCSLLCGFLLQLLLQLLLQMLQSLLEIANVPFESISIIIVTIIIVIISTIVIIGFEIRAILGISIAIMFTKIRMKVDTSRKCQSHNKQ